MAKWNVLLLLAPLINANPNRLLLQTLALKTPSCFSSDPYCAAYSDGCNICHCNANNFPICTWKLCPPTPFPLEEYCIECMEGYTFNSLASKCEPPSPAPATKPSIIGCGGIPFCASYQPAA